MISEKIYGLLTAVSKDFKFIAYDKLGGFFVTDKRGNIKDGVLIDLWRCNSKQIDVSAFPCLNELFVSNKEAVVYNIETLVSEYEQNIHDVEIFSEEEYV